MNSHRRRVFSFFFPHAKAFFSAQGYISTIMSCLIYCIAVLAVSLVHQARRKIVRKKEKQAKTPLPPYQTLRRRRRRRRHQPPVQILRLDILFPTVLSKDTAKFWLSLSPDVLSFLVGSSPSWLQIIR